jgi:hypothetical protein
MQSAPTFILDTVQGAPALDTGTQHRISYHTKTKLCPLPFMITSSLCHHNHKHETKRVLRPHHNPGHTDSLRKVQHTFLLTKHSFFTVQHTFPTQLLQLYSGALPMASVSSAPHTSSSPTYALPLVFTTPKRLVYLFLCFFVLVILYTHYLHTAMKRQGIHQLAISTCAAGSAILCAAY